MHCIYLGLEKLMGILRVTVYKINHASNIGVAPRPLRSLFKQIVKWSSYYCHINPFLLAYIEAAPTTLLSYY